MTTLPLASILINNYNYEAYVGAAIDSAIGQTYPHCEIIVVDDGSTDNSKSVIQAYGEKYSQVKPIFQINQGQAAAFNQGFAQSQGDVIFLLDADDIFQPQKVERVMAHLAQDPTLAWCFHPMLKVDKSGAELPGLRESFTGSAGVYDVTQALQRGKLSGQLPFSDLATSGLCFRRSTLGAILPMPTALRITSDNYVKYAALGLGPGYVDLDHLSHQRLHGNNAYTLKPGISDLRLAIDVMTAHTLRQNFPPLTPFCHNLFAYARSQFPADATPSAETQTWINRYQESLSLKERGTIALKQRYYQFKFRQRRPGQ